MPTLKSTVPVGRVDPLVGLTVAVSAMVKPWSACCTEDVNDVLVATVEGDWVDGALMVTVIAPELDCR